MGGMAYLLFAWVFPALLGSGPREAVAARVRLVEGEGRQLARARCGGRIGGLNFNGALTVTVFTSGLVIKPFLMQPLALTLAAIDTVRFGRNFWFRSMAIGHSSVLLAPTVVLYCREDSAVAGALRSLVPHAFGEQRAE